MGAPRGNEFLFAPLGAGRRHCLRTAADILPASKAKGGGRGDHDCANEMFTSLSRTTQCTESSSVPAPTNLCSLGFPRNKRGMSMLIGIYGLCFSHFPLFCTGCRQDGKAENTTQQNADLEPLFLQHGVGKRTANAFCVSPPFSA